jgi:hypothetical protein
MINKAGGGAFRKSQRKLVILAITTHGGVPINQNGTVIKYRIPAGMTFTKLAAVVPGICNLADHEDTEKAVTSILKSINDFAVGDLKTKDELVSSMGTTLRKQSREVVRDTATFQLKETRAGTADTQSQDFVRMSGNMYKIATRISGEEVIDKIYTRDVTELAKTPWDLKIHLLTEPGYPDLMRELIGRRSGRLVKTDDINEVVYLHDIINELITRYPSQMLDIVLVDLTCSIFGDFETDFTQPGTTEVELTQRAQRLLRRHLLAQGLFGGKRKKLKKDKKTQQNKKGRKRKTAKVRA